ncbi:MAG: DUF1543 domain-containing protein [Bacteroidota bacterium]
MEQKLFMLLLGCKPKGRNTEQHDIFFGIGTTLKDLIGDIKKSWAEAKGNIHIDAWREVNCVDGYSIQVEEIAAAREINNPAKKENELFFINLGGYKENEFDEFHYRLLVVADSLDKAKNIAKKTSFFKHITLASTVNHPAATSHIDDKYGIDVDDLYAVEDILPVHIKAKYKIIISSNASCKEDGYHLGYSRIVDL